MIVLDDGYNSASCCARCMLGSAAGRTAASLAGPSLAQLASAQNAIAQFQLAPTLARPLTGEHIATIAYALGVLSAERLAAGERLQADETKGAGL